MTVQGGSQAAPANRQTSPLNDQPYVADCYFTAKAGEPADGGAKEKTCQLREF
jgi:hypothetical protein